MLFCDPMQTHQITISQLNTPLVRACLALLLLFYKAGPFEALSTWALCPRLVLFCRVAMGKSWQKHGKIVVILIQRLC